MNKKKKSEEKDLLPVLESMRQVSAATGMPHVLVKSLKNNGCRGFLPGGRVRLSDLLKSFFREYYDETEKPPDGLATWREALNRVQTHRQEILLSKDKGTVLDLPEAERRAAEGEAYYFAECDRMLREMPTALCGLSAGQIHQRIAQFVIELKARSREKFKAVVKP